MKIEPTDDYLYIINETYREDKKLREDFHFCSPSSIRNCASHTLGDIFNRTDGDVSFFAILEDDTDAKTDVYDFSNGGLIGFAAFDMDMGRLFSFGIRIEHRRKGIFPIFMEELRKLSKKEELAVIVTENNERDMIVFREIGLVEIGMDYENSEKILIWA